MIAVTLTCPPWCELEPGHGIDKAVGNRMHIRQFGQVQINQMEVYEPGYEEWLRLELYLASEDMAIGVAEAPALISDLTDALGYIGGQR